jgi:hypothetical protein
VTAPLTLTGDCRQIFTHMAEQLYDKLINLWNTKHWNIG